MEEIQRRELEKKEALFHYKEQKGREKELQQERLDKVVEGYSFRPQVEGDFDRLVAETAAREIRKVTVTDAADQVSLFKNNGYTTDGLRKDIRFKVSTALAEAGLQGTSYGQELLRGLGKPRAPTNIIS